MELVHPTPPPAQDSFTLFLPIVHPQLCLQNYEEPDHHLVAALVVFHPISSAASWLSSLPPHLVLMPILHTTAGQDTSPALTPYSFCSQRGKAWVLTSGTWPCGTTYPPLSLSSPTGSLLVVSQLHVFWPQDLCSGCPLGFTLLPLSLPLPPSLDIHANKTPALPALTIPVPPCYNWLSPSL